jgi:hypothetical protein
VRRRRNPIGANGCKQRRIIIKRRQFTKVIRRGIPSKRLVTFDRRSSGSR